MTHEEFKEKIADINRQVENLKQLREIIEKEFSEQYAPYPIGMVVMYRDRKGWIRNLEFNLYGEFNYVIAGFKKNGEKSKKNIVSYFTNNSLIRPFKDEIKP